MAKRRMQFDIKAHMQLAWDLLYAASVKREKSRSHAFVTASDMEDQIRQFAAEVVAGEPVGTRGAAWGTRGFHSVRISCPNGARLLDVCRDWLLLRKRMGTFQGHNFCHGHISGMRFRPSGVILPESERKTILKRVERIEGRAKPAVVHFDVKTSGWTAHLLCMEKARLTKAAKGIRNYRGMRRSNARHTREEEKVTCPRCLKLIAEGAHVVARSLSHAA